MDRTKKLLTVTELEEETGIRRETAYRLSRMGTIPSYRVGPKLGGVRFIADEVLAALRRECHSPAS